MDCDLWIYMLLWHVIKEQAPNIYLSTSWGLEVKYQIIHGYICHTRRSEEGQQILETLVLDKKGDEYFSNCYTILDGKRKIVSTEC